MPVSRRHARGSRPATATVTSAAGAGRPRAETSRADEIGVHVQVPITRRHGEARIGDRGRLRRRRDGQQGQRGRAGRQRGAEGGAILLRQRPDEAAVAPEPTLDLLQQARLASVEPLQHGICGHGWHSGPPRHIRCCARPADRREREQLRKGTGSITEFSTMASKGPSARTASTRPADPRQTQLGAGDGQAQAQGAHDPAQTDPGRDRGILNVGPGDDTGASGSAGSSPGRRKPKAVTSCPARAKRRGSRRWRSRSRCRA